MAYKALSFAAVAFLTVSKATSPLVIRQSNVLPAVSLPECPGNTPPPDNGTAQACLLPENNCAGLAEQRAELSSYDPRFAAIATLENSGGNCGHDTVQIPTTGNKPNSGGSTNCGAFNNNVAAIQTYCPQYKSQSPEQICQDFASSTTDAANCQQSQISAVGFSEFAQLQRCGQLCSSTVTTCGDPSNGLTCTEAGAQYEGAINHITSVQQANPGSNTTGNAYLSNI
ncbi:hypothetical protein MMC28_001705 [Mycoblastus sanguinarius]|nr:hypothetical protein [Mycoblastus sanguinarius]